LPFKNIGTPGENDHIVEGIVDDLNTMLTNVDGLRVIGSASAKTYRDSDKTPAEIGHELNAGTLLQGSIQKTGSDLKINVRLIDTTTSENIWANSFSGSENDRSKFQQEIIQSIVNKTKGTILNQSELSSLTQGDTESAEAYNLVKEGVDLLKGHSREGTQRAIDLMLQAIELDPNYSNAYMGLARAYQLSSSLSLHEPTTAFNLAKKYGQKALEINPNLPGFEIIKITFSQDGQRNPEEMMNRLDSLLKKYPNNSDLLREAGDIYSFSGRNKKAIETLHQGLKLDPKNAWFHQYLAYTYLITGDKKLAEHHNSEALKLKPYFQFALHIRSLILSRDNRFDEIESELLKAIQNDAQNPVTTMSLGIVYWRSGQKEKSYKLLAELLDRRNFEYIKSGILARFYIAIGEKEKSLKWLQQSSKESDTDFVDLFHWPLFDEVRSDPEFIQIYKDAGIFEHFTTEDSR
jgi:TolB-like protein